MESQGKIQKYLPQFGLSAARVTLHVNYGMLEEDEERLAFCAARFCPVGSFTDPAKRYHLEMTTSHYQGQPRDLRALLLDAGFAPKETTRSGNSILYFKQSDMIEDFLTAIGAPVCAMGVMEAKVEKIFAMALTAASTVKQQI